MNRIVYIATVLFASITLFVISDINAGVKTYKVSLDTLKIEHGYIPFPSWINIELKYYNYYFDRSHRATERIFRTNRLDIVREIKRTGVNKKFRYDQVSEKFNILYSFTGNDTAAFSAVFISIKYDNEYYIVAFPHQDEWGFVPFDNKDGYFLYTPVGFHLDTVKWTLTRLKYDQNFKIDFKKQHHALIYDDFKYPIVSQRPYAFSKKQNEFAFGKAKTKYLKM